jgi:hypothetical protein
MHSSKQINFRLFLVIALVFAVPISQLNAATMITTDRVISDMSAERDRVQAFLQRTDVQKKIVALGVSPTEATKRVASLSDAEVKKISGQLDRLHAGGDGIYLGLGALILLVILIYVLVRR